MRRIFLTLAAVVFLSMPVVQGQNYTALWKQYAIAQEKDLPKTQLSVLEKIASKAEREKAYGQLLAAELRIVAVQTQIAPDSLSPEIAKLKKKVAVYGGTQAKDYQDGSNPVLAAVYAGALGKLYKNAYVLKDHHKNSDDFFAWALRNPDLLAAQKAADFKPVVVDGVDERIARHRHGASPRVSGLRDRGVHVQGANAVESVALEENRLPDLHVHRCRRAILQRRAIGDVHSTARQAAEAVGVRQAPNAMVDMDGTGIGTDVLIHHQRTVTVLDDVGHGVAGDGRQEGRIKILGDVRRHGDRERRTVHGVVIGRGPGGQPGGARQQRQQSFHDYSFRLSVALSLFVTDCPCPRGNSGR